METQTEHENIGETIKNDTNEAVRDTNKAPKRHSIRGRMLRTMLFITVVSMIINVFVGYVGMTRIKRDANQGTEDIGRYASGKSKEALLLQTQESLFELVKDKANYAQAKLQSFRDFVRVFAEYAQGIYTEPLSYPKKDVLPPQKENEGIYSMQRYLSSKEIALSKVSEEIGLLGNLEHVFSPVMQFEDAFATVYIGTESGFLLSYDDAAQKAFEEDEEYKGEFIFPFADSEWYQAAKHADEPVFTDTYQDSYGRGLTVTCVCPIYDGQGSFRGAVALDILVGDLTNSLVEGTNNGDSYAFLVNDKGEVIASPHLEADSTVLPNISTDAKHPAYSVSKSILSGSAGIALTADGVYYVYSPIPRLDWIFVMSIPIASVVEPIRVTQMNIEDNAKETADTIDGIVQRTIVTFILTFLSMIALACVNAWNFAGKLTLPIIELGKDVEKRSLGDLDHRSKVKTGDEIEVLADSFNFMAEAMQNYIKQVTEMTTEQQRLSTELDIATNIQQSMLPHVFELPPGHEEYDIYASMDPAKEVGGDFYDFFLVDDDHLAMVMADVSGKGVPAALFMVVAKTLIKTALQSAVSPEKVLTKVNDQLSEGNDAEMFVTVWVGILELSTGILRCANAGHEYPAIRRADGEYELYHDTHGLALAWMPGVIYKKYTIQLNPGDCIFVYTDGVPEATDANNELFGTDRMLKALNTKDMPSCEDKLRMVREQVDAFVDGAPQFDDLTMLCMQYKGGKPRMQELTLEAVVENIPQVMDFVHEKLDTLNCPETTRMQIDVAIDEMFSNISYYAYNPETGPATVKVEVEENPLSVVISFVDNGIPYDPLEKDDPDTELSLEGEGIGGLGIFMVKQTMDDVAYEYRNGQNILKIKKTIGTSET